MYWPLIIGFVCFVLVTILIGWIVDAPRRRGTDRHCTPPLSGERAA